MVIITQKILKKGSVIGKRFKIEVIGKNIFMEELKDKICVCKDCHRKFMFTVKEQKDFGQKGWADPVRCKYCRRQKSILNLILKDGISIGDEIRFSEICDKCGRSFYTNIKRKIGVNLYCDDCWVEIKYVNAKDRKKDEGVAKSKTEANR